MPNNTRAPSAEITPESIRRLVESFYGRVQEDPELGPIFEAVIGRREGGWPPHLERMTAFWSAVLLHQPGFRGNPRLAHDRVGGIGPAHFARWLFLFRLEAHRVFTEAPARRIVAKAEAMAVHLQRPSPIGGIRAR